MKVIGDKTNKKGKRILTVEMSSQDSQLVEVKESCHYRLGGQHEDVVGGHVLLGIQYVYWCDIQQEWVTQ